MRIIAISDTSWLNSRFIDTIKNLKPSIILLAGDCNELEFSDEHGKEFYDFLKSAGKKSKILSVRGNHDDPKYGGDGSYSEEKINRIKGCYEISRKCLEIDNLKFLGVDYDLGRVNKTLLPLLEKFPDVDIIVSHCEISKIRRLARQKPMFVVNGHTMGGLYVVDNTPIVLSSNIGMALIEIKNNSVKSIKEYQFILKKPHIITKNDKISKTPKRIDSNYEWIEKPAYKKNRGYFVPLHQIHSD